MPRIARNATLVSNCNHVICRGNNRRKIFFSDSDRAKYLDIVAKYQLQYGFLIYHYVLMSNHVHLVISQENQINFSNAMQCINQAYSWHARKMRRKRGHLWEERYKHIGIEDDEHLLTCGLYTELNPVRAGMVNDPSQWQWSSYAHYAFGDPNPLITDSPGYSSLGTTPAERQRVYQKLANMWISERRFK
ncbi:MAG: transposase [bacterium]